jgi:hypothetical protein
MTKTIQQRLAELTERLELVARRVEAASVARAAGDLRSLCAELTSLRRAIDHEQGRPTASKWDATRN